MKRSNVVEIARTYVGTPFVHQGRAPRVALDCGGVFICLLREFKLSDYDRKDYGPNPEPNQAMNYTRESGAVRQKLVRDLKAGDIAIIGTKRVPTHIAICTEKIVGGYRIVHASPTSGKVVEHDITEAVLCAAFEFLAVED